MPTIPATGRVTTAQVQQVLSRGPWARRAGLLGGSGQELAAMTPIFTVFEGRMIAANDAAKRLRETVPGARVVARLEGALAVEAGRAAVREIVLADAAVAGDAGGSQARVRRTVQSVVSAQAMITLAHALSSMSARARREFERDMRAPTHDAVRALVEIVDANPMISADAAILGDDRMYLAPHIVLALRSKGAGIGDTGTRYVAEVIAHEIEHTVSPAAMEARGELDLTWLEEGTADVLARWPGVARRMATAMGLDAPKRAPRLDAKLQYDRYTAVVRSLLALAGLDVSKPDQLDAARELLQGGPLRATPRRLAEAIVKERGLVAASTDLLERMIRSLNGSLQLVASLKSTLARMAAASSARS